MNMCSICHGFLVDFICFPLPEPLRSCIKWKKFSKVSHSLAIEFQKIFLNLGELEEFYICKQILLNTDFHKQNLEIPEECVRGMLKLNGLLEIKHKENIKQILFILEDNGIIYDQHVQLLWVGYCLEHLWIHLKNIHNEHSGLQPPSYSGPPIGINKQHKKVVVIENYFDELYT
jgi:hypothetical protein